MPSSLRLFCFFFFNDTATTEIYTLSLHDALPISFDSSGGCKRSSARNRRHFSSRSEEHTSELQSLAYLVCRLLLEKKTTSAHGRDWVRQMLPGANTQRD